MLGEKVYNNQGGCRQCHKIKADGGIQGPDLTRVGKRLSHQQLLTSVYNPSLEIAKGYGTSVVTLKDGTALMGRVAKETKKQIQFVAADGKQSTVGRDEIANITPPISAMPPMAAALQPEDLRNLVAYLASLGGSAGEEVDADAHGGADPAEAYAK